jgi:hypothetical protein
MVYNHRHVTRIGIIIITTTLILLCRNINAQPGYYPILRRPPVRQIIVPYPPRQSYRQDYNQNISPDGFQPFISFGIHFDPLISWFTTDGYNTRSDGVVPGFNFGVSYNRYFSPNYSFSSGINIINSGGRLISREATNFELNNYGSVIVPPGEVISYKITYLSIPLGLKLQTSQIGFGRFFADLGFDPKIMISGTADIPSQEIKGGNASPELNIFNLSFHVLAGMEYPLGEYNNFLLGIGFDKNLFDITRNNGSQASAVVIEKMLSFRMGITF